MNVFKDMTRVLGHMRTVMRQSYGSYHCHNSQSVQRLTSQEVATALRPFFFAVHPDRFWRYPKEKDTNEDSLKQLNAVIEDAIEMRDTVDRRITFFMREEDKSSHNETNVRLKQIHINLFRREDVNKIVHKILIECKLSTDYLNRIGKKPKVVTKTTRRHVETNGDVDDGSDGSDWFKAKNVNDFTVDYNDINYSFDEFTHFVQKKTIETNLKQWLKENIDSAKTRLKTIEPIRQELNRLNERLKCDLGLRELLWKDCGWGLSHMRAALKSVDTLRQQYGHDFHVLRGRTLAFGPQTGVSFDGHVVLNIEDVRHNWLKMIRSVENYDKDLERLPFFESTLSGVLRGIQIDHPKLRPSVLVKSYIKQLEKLTEALVQHIAKNGIPGHWPPSLNSYQLVVECESGPLMVSPTGQFIVPASCPAFLLIDFITDNLFKSRLLRDMSLNYRSKEILLTNECRTQLWLQSIEKADNVTPDLMTECCENLMANKDILMPYLRDSRLHVCHYYSVLLDGEICIPWNFIL